MILLLNLARSSSRFLRILAARIASPGRIRLGKDVVMGKGVRVGRDRKIQIGDRVFIGGGFHCMSNATIGDDVMISSSVAFIGDDHPFDDPNLNITQGIANPAPHVIVEGDNLIGYGTIVIGDVRICRGAIVAAGSLVTRDLTEVAVYAGRPAVPVRPRYLS